jgi:hypothetical protein
MLERVVAGRLGGVAMVLLVVAGGCSHGQPFMVPSRAGEPPAADTVDHRRLLIGDAGDPDPDGEPTLHALRC